MAYSLRLMAKEKLSSITLEKMNRIDDKLIEKLYREYGTPEHVKKHCFGVTDCALKIAKALNENGYELDLELIYGAGMVHDMARTSDRHWDVAADKLEKLGFFEEADIVRVHMMPAEYSPIDEISEKDMVCLADRLVKEDEYVGIDERFDYIIDKARKNGMTDNTKIIENKAKMQRCLDEIEAKIGRKIDDLF